MRFTFRQLLIGIPLLIIVTSCANSDGVFEDGPRLVNEVTIAPITELPTRARTPVNTPDSTRETEAPPLISPTAVDSSLVTPTLPPTKTATLTKTITPTLEDTPIPPPTTESPPQVALVPTLINGDSAPQDAVVPDTNNRQDNSEVSAPVPGAPSIPRAPCTTGAIWFFEEPIVPECPAEGATSTNGAYQPFEFGYMLWIESQDLIYVLFDDNPDLDGDEDLPSWRTYADEFSEGMPAEDSSLNSLARPFTWQPKRGFGLIWRRDTEVRQRLGWAIREQERPFTVEFQVSTDGALYIAEPLGGVFKLLPDGVDWERFRD